MAGDAINDLVNQANGNRNFQPAAGVEIALLWLVGGDGNTNWYLYDGVNVGQIVLTGTGTRSIKVHITNTRYLRICNGSAGNVVTGFTGVQTK